MTSSLPRRSRRLRFGATAFALLAAVALCNSLGPSESGLSTGEARTARERVVLVGFDVGGIAGVVPIDGAVTAALIERITRQRPLALGVEMPSVPMPGAPALPAAQTTSAAPRTLVAMSHGSEAMKAFFRGLLAGREVGQPPQTMHRGADGRLTPVQGAMPLGALARAWWGEGAIARIDGKQTDRGAAVARGAPVPTFSAIDVLAGRVPADSFTGRIVVVGRLDGDLAARQIHALRRQAGVIASVSALDEWRAQLPATQHAPWHALLFALGSIGLLLPRFWNGSPRRMFAWTAGIATVGGTAAFVRWHVEVPWLGPAATLTTMAVASLGWPWSGLQRHFGRAVAQFAPAGAPWAAPRRPIPAAAPELDAAPLNALASDACKAGDSGAVNVLLSGAIESLPDIVLVCDAQGNVLLANRAAHTYFGAGRLADGGRHDGALRGRHLLRLLDGLTPLNEQGAWPRADGRFDFERHDGGIDCRDDDGAEFLLKWARCAALLGEDAWTVSLVDLAPLRSAQRGRDDAMSFLSHDLRSPLTAILALLSLYRSGADGMQQDEMLARIRRLTNRSLALAEAFTQLSRAEPVRGKRVTVDLADVLMDAADDCWSQARAKHVQIDVDVPATEAACVGDAELLRRAFITSSTTP